MTGRDSDLGFKKLNILGSIRAKYIVTFALLISISFLLLAVIISSAISNYIVSTRFSVADESAALVGGLIKDLEELCDKDYDSVLSDYPDKIQSTITNVSQMNGVAVVVTDRIGNVKFSAIPDELKNDGNRVVPVEAMHKLSHESTAGELSFSNLYGFYSGDAVNESFAVKNSDGFVDGIIIVSVASSGIESFTASLIQTLLLSFIWITIATVIVAVFISERIVSPLKNMKKAATSYEKGDYDVDVLQEGTDNEIAELAAAFNSMAIALKEKEMAQRSFLGSVSHDMRTPMTSMAGFVDGILDGTIPPEKQEYYLRIVSAETHRLSRLVNSILDITRIQSGERKFNKAEFDICELLRLILISMEKQIDDKNLRVEFEPCREKCMVYADSDGIHQVAYNLIHNAIKFTDEGGLLKIGVDSRSDGSYIVSVFNTGKGIKKQELPYIFDRFYKTDPSRGLDKSGAGLGLFIVKTILTSQGEQIFAESEEDSYACFKFTLHSKNSTEKNKTSPEKESLTDMSDSRKSDNYDN